MKNKPFNTFLIEKTKGEIQNRSNLVSMKFYKNSTNLTFPTSKPISKIIK